MDNNNHSAIPKLSGLVDAHTHIYDHVFDSDLESVIKGAEDAGVNSILAVAEEIASAEKILALAEKYPIIKPCAGLHPCSVQNEQQVEDMMAFISKHAERLVCIGEVGLDFSPFFVKDEKQKELQRFALSQFVKLSKTLDLPLNVHSRSAGRPTIALLHELKAEKVLLHAFDGKPAVAMQGVSSGYFFSIPPLVVRDPQTQNLVKRLPLSSILLESDCPALAPVKGERNEPKNIALACAKIAEIKGISPEEVARITTQNCKRLFAKLDQ